MPYFFMQRIIEEGVYICKNRATIRQTAKHFALSKSCIHKDVTQKLKQIDINLYKKVQKVLKVNLNQRHIRGGIATRNKYCNKNMR